MGSILHRGPHQYRVQVRRKGVNLCKTFETLQAAQDWCRVTEGKVTGDEYVDLKATRSTTLAQACAWMQGQLATNANARNEATHLTYWSTSKFAAWSLNAIHDWDLIEWRREVLDEESGEDEGVGPAAQFGAQTCIHRMNAMSKLIQTWARANKVPLENPVRPGVRPAKPDGRNRRVYPDEELRLLARAALSSRPWLSSAIILAIETGLRQSEQVSLTWDRVRLDAEYPHLDLLKTKNDRARRIPLSVRAVKALESLERKTNKVFPIFTPTGVVHAFRDAIGWEAFPDLRWHDLRHEAVSRLFENTDLRDHEIMAISGHLTPAMLSRYTHLRSDRLGERLPGGRMHKDAVQA
jgi:integrase